MRWIATIAAALTLCLVTASCCCRSVQQGFQQGVQQAKQQAQLNTAPSPSPAESEGAQPQPVSGDEGTIRLVNLVVGDAIDEATNVITNEIDIFWPSDPTMHVSALLLDAPEGTTVKGELIGVALDMGEDGLVTDLSLSELEVSATGEAELPVYFDFHAPDGGWPLGEYACDLSVNGEFADSIEMEVVPESEPEE